MNGAAPARCANIHAVTDSPMSASVSSSDAPVSERALPAALQRWETRSGAGSSAGSTTVSVSPARASPESSGAPPASAPSGSVPSAAAPRSTAAPGRTTASVGAGAAASPLAATQGTYPPAGTREIVTTPDSSAYSRCDSAASPLISMPRSCATASSRSMSVSSPSVTERVTSPPQRSSSCSANGAVRLVPSAISNVGSSSA